jgi:hypothetical protein
MSHDEFKDLLAVTKSLPRSIEPERDLWPGIEARLDEAEDAPVSDKVVRADFTFGSRTMLAAAAVLVVFVVALTTGVLNRDPAGSGPAVVDVTPAIPGEAAPLDVIDATHASASRDVLAALTRDKDLDPETVELIRANLEIIETAIAEIRAALAADPENAGLNRLLTTEYQRRGEVLRRAARLADSI